LLEDAIDLGGCGADVVEDCLGDGDMFLHAIKSLVLTIVEGVVDACAGFLRLSDRCADDVDDRGAFGVGACDCVYGGEFTNAEGCYESAES
jgi:hypothetical protein